MDLYHHHFCVKPKRSCALFIANTTNMAQSRAPPSATPLSASAFKPA
jgi:hypothetical protein